MLILDTDISCVTETKKFLSTKFSMKDLGDADVILGLKIIQTDTGLALSQSHCVEKMITCYGYQDLPGIDTSYKCDLKLKPNSRKSVRQLEYASVIGSLMYATTATRPDKAFAVRMLSRFTSNPGIKHWKAVKRVMRYLKKTQTYVLYYNGDPSVVEGFSDASWFSEVESERSTGGYIFTMGGAAISWKSKKQTMLSRSSMKSEFFVLDTAAEKAEWLWELMYDLQVVGAQIPTILIYYDNQATATVASNDLFNGKKRTVRLKHRAVHDLIKRGAIAVIDVRSQENLADPFTKASSASWSMTQLIKWA
ncbi:uncharacterized protein M6B38_337145 [Iris pallida]|uniref:Polyprotein n=1 Tax=Iris pallida TaxID=29817 RepID=A0AAX6H099_IRIPA|nr:uncharacterized protein M6B38_337145 [Iris pallida]